MNKIVLLGAGLLLVAGLTSCHDVDNNYDPTIPEVPVAPNTVSGYISNLNGEPIKDATVKVGNKTAQSDAQGFYTISDLTAGDYAAEVTASSYVGVTGKVVMPTSGSSKNVTWSVVLAREVSQSFNVTVSGGGQGKVESEAIKGNTNGEIEMTVKADANTVPQNTTITITPIYTEESAKIGSRAESETLLIGANVTCSDPNLKLSNPINVDFDVDQTVVSSVVTKQYVNGQWQTVQHNTTSTGITVPTKEFAPIGLFFKVNVTQSNSTQALKFNPDKWDNLYGISPMKVGSSTYNYKLGSDYEARGANTLEALLIEYMARLVGPTARTVEGTYPLNMTLSIGQAVSISGNQAVTNYTVSSNSRSVTAKKYGVVTVTAIGTSRDHNGSGS